MERAAASLESYREWLKQRVATMPPCSPIGREAYTFFLKNVALYPYSPDQLLEMASQEWARSVSAEEIEHQRNIELPALKPYTSLDEQLQNTANLEHAIRGVLQLLVEAPCTLSAGARYCAGARFPRRKQNAPHSWLSKDLQQLIGQIGIERDVLEEEVSAADGRAWRHCRHALLEPLAIALERGVTRIHSSVQIVAFQLRQRMRHFPELRANVGQRFDCQLREWSAQAFADWLPRR